MANPVLVELQRGTMIESAHRGAVAIVDADGRTVFECGDVDAAIYPRSAVKPLQALPLIETGAADRYGLANEEIALACASHGGEPQQIAAVERMLARVNLDVAALECGAHWPSHQASSHALVRAGLMPTALHNNCSGKHAGFLCAARAMGVDHRGYVAIAHPVQREVKAVIESFTGIALSEDRCGVDGCSIPTWAVPLHKLAGAFARFGTGQSLSQIRRQAAARILEACRTKPYFIAGSGRFCTRVMELLSEAVLVKTGAEGVFCAALPERGVGIAIKCDDGSARAAEVIMAAALARSVSRPDQTALEPFWRPTLRNWNGLAIGELRPAPALTEP